MRHQLFGLRPWKRHSLVLAVLGTIYVLLGVTFFAPPGPGRDKTVQAAIDVMPLPAWGVVFIIVGLLSLLSSRWPPASETWGYTALSSLSALWGTVYIWGVVIYGNPASTLSGTLVWFGLAFLWWAISGLVNPPSRRGPTA